MYWLVLFIASGVVWAALEFGFLPPFHARTLIKIRAGKLISTKGLLLPHAKTSVTEILAAAQITHGFIAIVPGPRVKFSRNIPPELHQRLRNVLLNQ